MPQFGWNCYDDDSNSSDQRCDSPKLKALLRAQGDQPDPDRNKDDVKLSKRLGDKDVARALRRTICKFPSEWDRTTISQRYHWLNEMEYGFKDHPDDWKRFENHLKAITFEKLPQAYLDAQWHFHPTVFIKLFRKCGWRSLRELTQTLPRKSSGGAGGEILWDDASKRWERGNNNNEYMPPQIAIAVNRMWAKYGFATAQRQAHFLAQIFKETGALRATVENGDPRYLRTMYEVLTPQEAGEDFDHKHSWLQAMGFLRNRDRATYVGQRPEEITKKALALGNVETGEGSRFRGRGLIHLTGRSGYSSYESYRCRNFTTDPNPQLLSTDAVNVADSAGYFWVSKMMVSSNAGALRSGLNIHRRSDIGIADTNVAAVTTPVNGGSAGLPERQEFFHYVYFILGDVPEMAINSRLVRQKEN